MRSLLNRLLGWLLGPSSAPGISCSAAIWTAGVRELERRTRHATRESGAFLLGPNKNGHRHILEFVYYDDIDPYSLDTGIVHFNGNKLPKLWEYCRARGYGVIADVHVHPGGYGQSESDQADPVMPKAGHLAFIIPNFARGTGRPGEIGMYEYLGNGAWNDRSREGCSFFRLES